MQNFFEFALYHAWLIPALPALSFMLIVFLLRKSEKAASLTAIGLTSLSFLLALGVAGGIFGRQKLIAEPLTYGMRWFSMPGLKVEMGCLVDPLSGMMLFVVTLISTLVMIYSIGYMQKDPGYTRFFAYLSLFAASMLGLVLATNLLQLFVFWELVGLCSYLLIGFYYEKVSACEAAKKAFMTTRVGDFGLLVGIVLVQVMFSTLDFMELQTKLPLFANKPLLAAISLLIFVGPIAKSGQFPLHVWLPDAMEGPSPVSALIHAATMVVAGVYLVARAFSLFTFTPDTMTFIAYLGGFTAFFAATIAVTQREMKRILAYSTISQLGYMMMALGIGGFTASLFHLMTHAYFKALMFLAAGSVLHALHGKADIFEMGGLYRKMPWTSAFMLIGALAIAGIPPFAGFWSKDEILLTAKLNGFNGLYWLASLTAFLTAFYIFRMVFTAFFGKANSQDHPHESPYTMLAPMATLAVLSVVGGFAGAPWLEEGFGFWVRPGAYHHPEFDWTVGITSVLLALGGISLAWLIYGARKLSSDELAQKSGILYRLSYNKYYIDELYQWVAAVFADGTAKVLYWVDLYIVDGFINALAQLTGWLGERLRYLQTGQVQTYALVLFVSVVVMLLIGGLAGGGAAALALIGGITG